MGRRDEEADAEVAGGCAAAVGGGSGVAAADAFAGPAGAVSCGAAGVLAADRDGGHDGRGRARRSACRGRSGARWFRHAGGMPPISLDEPTGRYLSFAEREEIALLRAQDKGVREIARRIGRDPGTISRELRRNAATRGGKQVYRAVVAQWKAQQAAKRPKTAKLVGNDRLREYVQDRLAGSVRRPDGTIVTGPETPAVEGAEQAAPAGQAVGDGVEPGADRAPAAGRLPR